MYFASSKGKILRRRSAVPAYEFVPQVVDLNPDDSDTENQVQSSFTSVESNRESGMPVRCSPSDEHQAVCVKTKRTYERYNCR